MMVTAGWALVAVGLAIMGYAFFGFDVSMANPGPAMMGMGDQRVVNLQLLDVRDLVFQAGGLAVLCGSLAICAGELAGKLASSASPHAQADPTAGQF